MLVHHEACSGLKELMLLQDEILFGDLGVMIGLHYQYALHARARNRTNLGQRALPFRERR